MNHQHQRPHTRTTSISGSHGGSCLKEREAYSLAHYLLLGYVFIFHQSTLKRPRLLKLAHGLHS